MAQHRYIYGHDGTEDIYCIFTKREECYYLTHFVQNLVLLTYPLFPKCTIMSTSLGVTNRNKELKERKKSQIIHQAL